MITEYNILNKFEVLFICLDDTEHDYDIFSNIFKLNKKTFSKIKEGEE